MHEHVLAAGVRDNEAETLISVEPLHGAVDLLGRPRISEPVLMTKAAPRSISESTATLPAGRRRRRRGIDGVDGQDLGPFNALGEFDDAGRSSRKPFGPSISTAEAWRKASGEPSSGLTKPKPL